MRCSFSLMLNHFSSCTILTRLAFALRSSLRVVAGDSDDSGISPPISAVERLRNLRSSSSTVTTPITPPVEATRRGTNFSLIYPLNGPSPTKGPARADFLKRYMLQRPDLEKKDTNRLFKRYAFLAGDENVRSPWEVTVSSQLEEVLLKWR